MTKECIIKIMLNNELTTIFISRQRDRSNQLYVKLIQELFQIMTTQQIKKLIQYYAKPVIAYDDILNEFFYNGVVDANKNSCICGVHIKHNHSITNIETHDDHIIGSTCCKHWENKSHHSLKPKSKANLLKDCFQILKQNRNNAPRLTFGQYRNKLFSSIVKHNKQYCNWILQTFDDKEKNIKIKNNLKAYM